MLVNGGDDRAGIAVEAVLGPVIADFLYHLAGNLGDVNIAGGGNLAHHMNEAGSRRGFAGHAGLRVLGDDGVQHTIRDLVANFVGMSLRYGFGCKESFCHNDFLLSVLGAKNTPPGGGVLYSDTPSSFDRLPPDLAPCALQVAGLHWAVPSTTLDKAIQLSKAIIEQPPLLVKGFFPFSA